jgi:hypothetical protein
MKISKKYIIFVFLFLILFPILTNSTIQKTNLLDLDNPVFNFTEDRLSPLNGSSQTFDVLFYGNENKTLYIRIPKNSTIFYSNITLKGQMRPIQSSAIEEIWSLAVGNVTNSPENEIAVAATSYVFLLNSSSFQIWNFSVSGVPFYDVAIGNVSSDVGNEIVAGAGNSRIYVLNSSGNLKFDKVIGGIAYSVAVGDVNSSIDYDEIAVGGGDSKIYLFDSQGNQIWNYSAGGAIYGIAIGNVSSDVGNEIVAGGSDYKVYVLNSSGNLKFEKMIGEIINDVAVGNVNSSIDYDEIAVALNNGTVLLLDYEGNILWKYTIPNAPIIDTIAIGEVTDEYNGKEVVVGANDNNVYILSSSGSLIWNFATGDFVRGIDIANLTADPGNEVIAGTRKTQTTINLYVLNFEYFPTNPWLDIGNDTVIDWSFSGKFRGESWASNNSAFQNYLSTCIPNSDGNCDIPLIFHSDFSGDLNITSINITYQYNISDIVSYQIVTDWSRTNNIKVNESVGNVVKNITYLKNPAVSVRFSNIKVSSTATKCDFDGISYNVSSGICGPFPEVEILSTRFDKVWDDTMSTDKPVLMNESFGYIEEGFWKKNITIWNTSSANFTNVIANTSINESVIADAKLKVDWYNNGTLYDITPNQFSTNCNTSNPTFYPIVIGNDTFLVCKQDFGNDGVADLFVWKQPFTKGYTKYQASGSANNLAQLKDFNVTPSQAIWGSSFNISVNVSDAEGDNVTVRLYVNLTNTFNTSAINLSQVVWNFIEEKNVTDNTISGSILTFNLSTNKSWTGINLFKFEYNDYNLSIQKYLHDWRSTSVLYGPNVTKHNVLITNIEGNDTSVNRTQSVLFVVQINDTDFNNQSVEGARCIFYVSLNDTNWDLGYSTLSNSTGYCSYSFIPNSSYMPGLRFWNVIIDDSYYSSNFSENYTVKIYGKININLTEDTFYSNATRQEIKNLRAKIYDEFGQIIRISGYDCNWYIAGINRSFENSTQTNSSGYCSYSWLTNCSDDVGTYTINVTLSGNVNQYYLQNKTQDIKNITLKDNLNITIVSPQEGTIYHPNDTVIYLNSTLKDYCNSTPSHEYIVIWDIEEINPSVSPPPKESRIGDNATLNILTYPPGLLKINISVFGDLYNNATKNTTAWIYGRSSVNVSYPKNNQIYERTETIRTLNISCFVFNNDTTPPQISDYNVSIWNDSTYIASGRTNVLGYFNYTWNVSDLPDGNYTIRCSINDENIDYYNRYHAIKQNDTVYVIIREKDTMPPEILSISVNSTTPGNNVTIEARIRDWYGVNASWINLTYPNGTSQIIALSNTTPNLIDTIWKVTLFNLNQIGDYDFILYANDSSANSSLKPCIEDINHTSCAFSWFEIYQPIQLYINATYDIDFTFYRPGKNLIVHTFRNQSGNYNFTLHKRIYDFEVRFVDRYNQRHSIKFNSFNSTATAEYQNSTNITNPLKISDIDVRWIRVRSDYDDRHLAAIEIEQNMVFSNVSINLNYSKSLEGVRYEPAIRIFKCSNWNKTTVSCDSGWQELNSEPNLTTHTISTVQNSTSVYAVVEKGSALLLSPGQGGAGSGTTGGFTGSPGGGYSGYCGNRICDPGENPENCFIDCGAPFIVKTNLTEVYLLPEETKIYALSITNRLDKNITLFISVTGPIKGMVDISREVSLSSLSNITIPISVISPKETGTYTGFIVVEGANYKEELPVTINVLEKRYMPSLQLSVEILTKKVESGNKVSFKLTYDTKLKKRIDANLTYEVVEEKTRNIIARESSLKTLEGLNVFLDNITLPKNVSVGIYFLKVIASYDSETVSAVDSFEVILPIFTMERIRQITIISLTASFIAFTLYIRRIYFVRKAAKARYIFPIDFKLLPKGNLWLGKIAETNIKATFDINDLTTHLLIAGATGSGKSVTGSIFVEELLDNKIPVVVFDPTGQWTGFMRPCTDPKVLKYYKMHGLSTKDARFYPGNIIEITDPETKVDLRKYMNPGEITVFLLSKLKPGDYDKAITNLIDTIFEQGWEESTEVKLVVVFDEVHRLLEKYGGAGGYIALERACREFRKWGIGLIMISQVLSDFKEAIKGNVLTEIQMHTKSLGDLKRIESKYGLEFAKKVTKEEVGIGMIQNPKYNKGIPWFISFRPPLHMPHKLPASELEMYKRYNIEIEKIKLEIEKLEKAGKDVTDLNIDLKLALEKMKQGRFRMAEIYIESLKEKLGI